MQHYFAKLHGGEVSLSPSDTHHLLHVKRAKEGEKIEISLDDGNLYRATISSLSPLKIDLLDKIEQNREGDNPLTLCFCLLKGDHNDFIVQKGTELGVASFKPVVSSRCIVKPSSNKDNRIARLNKIAMEAAKQCRRNLVPEVSDYISFDDALELKADHKLLAYEGMAGSSQTLLSYIGEVGEGQSILALIGPEGGFSEEEATNAKEKGFHFISLGRRILRAETAAIALAALVGAKMDE